MQRRLNIKNTQLTLSINKGANGCDRMTKAFVNCKEESPLTKTESDGTIWLFYKLGFSGHEFG